MKWQHFREDLSVLFSFVFVSSSRFVHPAQWKWPSCLPSHPGSLIQYSWHLSHFIIHVYSAFLKQLIVKRSKEFDRDELLSWRAGRRSGEMCVLTPQTLSAAFLTLCLQVQQTGSERLLSTLELHRKMGCMWFQHINLQWEILDLAITV